MRNSQQRSGTPLEGKAEAADPRAESLARLLRAWPAGPAARWAPEIDVRAHSQPSPSISLPHTYSQLLFPTHFCSQEQQSPAPPEESSEPDTAQEHRAGCLLCLTPPCRRSPARRTAGCTPSSPRRHSGQWPHLTEGGKQESKESPASVRASARGRKQLRPRWCRCSRAFCSKGISRKQLLLKSA